MDLVLVPVTVTDQKDRIVMGLQKDSFDILDQNNQELIRHFSNEDAPISLGIIFEKFREDLISELRKLNSVSVVADESSAEAILGGGGEVWIKVYRSHNPQLGKVAPKGTPIYTGFLSIELRDKNGQTLWSYLATPPEASDDVSKDLSTLSY